MTTVGYGDIYPTTLLGYSVASMIIMLGLMITALPVAIIGRNYAILYAYNQKRMKRRRVEKEQLYNNIEIQEEAALENFRVRPALRVYSPFQIIQPSNKECTQAKNIPLKEDLKYSEAEETL